MRIVLILFIAKSLFALDSTVVESYLDKNEGFIGDKIKWVIKIKNIKGRVFQYPNIEIDNDSISIILLDSIPEENSLILEYQVVCWDTGNVSLPYYSLYDIEDGSKKAKLISTNRISLNIKSIFNDKTIINNIRPIKNPVPVSRLFPIVNFLLVSLIILNFCLILFFIFKKNKIKQVKPHNTVDHREIADKRLCNIDKKGFLKDAYTNLSHIIREYIENTLFIRSLEMTTSEIKLVEDSIPCSKENFLKIIDILELSDKIKYSKDLTSDEVLSNNISQVKIFIEDVHKQREIPLFEEEL